MEVKKEVKKIIIKLKKENQEKEEKKERERERRRQLRLTQKEKETNEINQWNKDTQDPKSFGKILLSTFCNNLDKVTYK